VIVIKIDWNKIEMDRLYRGEKTDYLNLVLKDNRDGPDQYGNDGFVIQDQTKEERDAKVHAPIIGNWRHLGNKPTRPQNERPDDRAGQRLPQPQNRRPERPAPQRQERPAPTRQRQGYDPNAEPDIEDPNFK